LVRSVRSSPAICAPPAYRIWQPYIAFKNPDSRQLKAARMQEITVCASAGEAAAQADLVVSSVTAGSALIAAESVARHLRHAPFYLDVNSVSPSTKQTASADVERAGGRYVEAAVMTSVRRMVSARRCCSAAPMPRRSSLTRLPGIYA
jgi:3-hydroxyisobutyrate dehydrogenase-like beta-hydroxyacid dehydrogenase